MGVMKISPKRFGNLRNSFYLCRRLLKKEDCTQKAIDKLWDEGVINEETIEQWGEEHMRTPYGYEAHRS